MSGEEMGVEEARVVLDDLWDDYDDYSYGFLSGHKEARDPIERAIRASERAAVLAEVEAMGHDHVFPDCLDNYNDPTEFTCGNSEPTLAEVIARIRNGGKA